VQHPGQRDLGGGGALLVRERMQQVMQRLVLDQVVPIEPGDDPAHVVAAVGSFAVTFPDRKPLARGLNGTKPMPSSSHAGMTSASNIRSMIEYSLWIAAIGVTACAPADLLDGGLRLSPATDLALRDQLAHHSGNVLDGHRRRYPVLVIQLDILSPQTRQRRLQPGPNLPTDLRAPEAESPTRNFVAWTGMTASSA
jgi:hypothetical protein